MPSGYKKKATIEAPPKPDVEDELRKVQSLLAATCEAMFCRPVEAVSGREVPFRIGEVAGLTKWWDEHRKKEEMRVSAIRSTALRKLTREEKEVLGI